MTTVVRVCVHVISSRHGGHYHQSSTVWARFLRALHICLFMQAMAGTCGALPQSSEGGLCVYVSRANGMYARHIHVCMHVCFAHRLSYLTTVLRLLCQKLCVQGDLLMRVDAENPRSLRVVCICACMRAAYTYICMHASIKFT